MQPRLLLLGGLVSSLVGLSGQAVAEPWIAVREGLSCASCHVNPTRAAHRVR